jgi:cation:H+ antiporter
VLLAILLLVAGALLLFVGAEAAIRGAGALASAAGIPLFAIGALLFGIDLEGLGTAVVAAGRGQPAVAGGSIFGTVAFLFGAAFGVALLLARRPVASPSAEHVLLPAAGLVAGAIACRDLYVGRLEGAMLIGLYAVYVAFVLYDRRLAAPRLAEIEHEAERGPSDRLRALGLTVAGLGVVALGAAGLVEGGVRVLARTALAPGFVGAALIGVLASLDEVLLSVLPIRRGQDELATGNLFGTLAAFSTGVLGITALVRPLALDGATGAALTYAAVLYGAVAAVFLWRGQAGKVLGASLLVSYGVWLALAARI